MLGMASCLVCHITRIIKTKAMPAALRGLQEHPSRVANALQQAVHNVFPSRFGLDSRNHLSLAQNHNDVVKFASRRAEIGTAVLRKRCSISFLGNARDFTRYC